MKLLLRLFLIYSWVNLVLLQGLPRVANYYFPGATRPWPYHQRSLPANLDNPVKSLARTYTKEVITYGSQLYKSLLSQADSPAGAQRKVLKLQHEFRFLEHTSPNNVRTFFHSKVNALIRLFKNAIYAPSHEILPILVRLVVEILVSLFQLISRNVITVSGARPNDEFNNALDGDSGEFLPPSLYHNKAPNEFMRTRALHEDPRNENDDLSPRVLKTRNQSVKKDKAQRSYKNKNQEQHDLKRGAQHQKALKAIGPEVNVRTYDIARYLPI
nr:PREDICTED: uncharacterized protein LOC103312604 [Tribolium castaneum]|eukprot:XP_008191862.1 PREDICTED: uncharacterized protein LOC103312604 [Tribolium castaneum]